MCDATSWFAIRTFPVKHMWHRGNRPHPCALDRLPPMSLTCLPCSDCSQSNKRFDLIQVAACSYLSRIKSSRFNQRAQIKQSNQTIWSNRDALEDMIMIMPWPDQEARLSSGHRTMIAWFSHLMMVTNCDMVKSWGTRNLALSSVGSWVSLAYLSTITCSATKVKMMLGN